MDVMFFSAIKVKLIKKIRFKQRLHVDDKAHFVAV